MVTRPRPRRPDLAPAAREIRSEPDSRSLQHGFRALIYRYVDAGPALDQTEEPQTHVVLGYRCTKAEYDAYWAVMWPEPDPDSAA